MNLANVEHWHLEIWLFKIFWTVIDFEQWFGYLKHFSKGLGDPGNCVLTNNLSEASWYQIENAAKLYETGQLSYFINFIKRFLTTKCAWDAENRDFDCVSRLTSRIHALHYDFSCHEHSVRKFYKTAPPCVALPHRRKSTNLYKKGFYTTQNWHFWIKNNHKQDTCFADSVAQVHMAGPCRISPHCMNSCSS